MKLEGSISAVVVREPAKPEPNIPESTPTPVVPVAGGKGD